MRFQDRIPGTYAWGLLSPQAGAQEHFWNEIVMAARISEVRPEDASVVMAVLLSKDDILGIDLALSLSKILSIGESLQEVRLRVKRPRILLMVLAPEQVEGLRARSLKASVKRSESGFARWFDMPVPMADLGGPNDCISEGDFQTIIDFAQAEYPAVSFEGTWGLYGEQEDYASFFAGPFFQWDSAFLLRSKDCLPGHADQIT